MDDDGEQLAWRETYFVLFQANDRPTLAQVEAAITDASSRLAVSNLEANDDGQFVSAVVQAPEDSAAMEISYEAGELVVEQSTELAKRLRKQLDDEQLARLLRADARLDVMHFERLAEGFEDDAQIAGEDDEEMFADVFDPASLITVVDALAKLTGGLAFDPADGDIMA